MQNFHSQVLPAIEMALLRDLPDVEYQCRAPGQKPGPGAEMVTRSRRPFRDEVEIYVFPQSWSDTSLGFGGVAGQAFTSAYTTVVVSENSVAAVYIGCRLAYVAKMTSNLMGDIRTHNMRGAADAPSKRYDLVRRENVDRF